MLRLFNSSKKYIGSLNVEASIKTFHSFAFIPLNDREKVIVFGISINYIPLRLSGCARTLVFLQGSTRAYFNCKKKLIQHHFFF